MRLVLAMLMLAGCTGAPADDPADAAPPDAGCSDGLCLAPPASGFQLRSVGTTIQPGEDVEYCEVVALPGSAQDTYYVSGFDVAMTTGSHHLIVSAADPGTGTEASAQVGDRRECLGASIYGPDLSPVTGSQQPTHQERFPAGVGRIYHGGQKVIFDYHYFNATEGPLPARAAVNFITTDQSQVSNLARAFGFYNLGIYTAPGEQSAWTGQCFFNQDVTVFKLTRHTHQWGTTFRVWYAGGPHDGELVFESPSWDEVDHTFAEPVTIPAGQGFRFECDYDNTTDHALLFGPNATDEMCILFGTWWTPVPGVAAASQSCQVTQQL